MRKRMLFMAAVGLAAAVAGAAVRPETLRRIDGYLATWGAGVPVPGFSAVVADRHGVMFAKGYGVERLGSPKPMTGRSPSAIGSLTKSFTALAILQLVEQGMVDLEAPVTRYLPWFRTMDREESDRITVRILLANSSGLPSDGVVEWIQAAGDDPRAMERGVRALAGSPLQRTGGTAFEYSNAGFNTAGVIVETVSGQPWAQYLQRNILDPLRMNHSTSIIARLPAIGALHGHTLGIGRALPAEPLFFPGSLAAGSELRSSAADLGRYLAALLAGGSLEGRRVISADGVARLWAPASSFTYASERLAADERIWSYGMGWFISRADGRTIVHHGGNTQTMSSYAIIDPAAGTAAAILLNVGAIDADRYVQPSTVANNLLHLLAGKPPTAWMGARGPDRTVNTYELPAALVGRYLGEYVSRDGDARIEVAQEGDRLEATLWRLGRPATLGVDFVTPATAWLRCIGGSFLATFSLTPDGGVTGLEASGFGVFVRRAPERFAKFDRVSIPGQVSPWSVPIPKGWSLERRLGALLAASPDRSTLLSIRLVTASLAADDDRWELVGGRPWRQRASRTDAGRTADSEAVPGSGQKVTVSTPAGGLELEVVLEAPADRITAAVRDVLLPLMGGTRAD